MKNFSYTYDLTDILKGLVWLLCVEWASGSHGWKWESIAIILGWKEWWRLKIARLWIYFISRGKGFC